MQSTLLCWVLGAWLDRLKVVGVWMKEIPGQGTVLIFRMVYSWKGKYLLVLPFLRKKKIDIYIYIYVTEGVAQYSCIF